MVVLYPTHIFRTSLHSAETNFTNYDIPAADITNLCRLGFIITIPIQDIELDAFERDRLPLLAKRLVCCALT